MWEIGGPPIKDLVEEWLARSENPASRLEAKLKAAKERIKQLGHERREEKKILELKQVEEDAKTEKFEKVIMMMAKELKNLQEGKAPEIASGKEKALEEAVKKCKEAEAEAVKLAEELKNAVKEKEELTETRKTLQKVVESVTANLEVKTKTKTKKKVNCRDVNKPNGCVWGERCKFNHSEEVRVVKEKDCSYWMDGHCRYEEKVCWNIHDPVKKGSKSPDRQSVDQSGFQEGQEQPRPGQETAAGGMDTEGWVNPRTRKQKRRLKETGQEKEDQEKRSQARAGSTTPV